MQLKCKPSHKVYPPDRPRATGKKMLVQTVYNEMGANMFDLTSANIADIYPGKDIMKMLILLYKRYLFYVPSFCGIHSLKKIIEILCIFCRMDMLSP